MANYGPDDLAISIDDSGGTPRVMTPYIREIGGFKIEQIIQEAHSFGDSWVEHLLTGLRRAGDITLRGFYDDAATTGPDVVFGTMTGPRTVVITWGAAKTSTFEALVVSYERSPRLNELTMFEVVLRPSGAVAEA